MKIGIILQGGLYNNHVVDNIKNIYSLYKKDMIISTWISEDKLLIEDLQNNNFNILLNKIPVNKGINNVNLQIISTKNGIKKFLNTDYTHILKIRTDMVPSNIDMFLKVLLDTSLTNLVFLCWFYQFEIEYICDFFLFGPIKKQYDFWNISKIDDELFPERFLTYHYTGFKYPKYNDIKNIYNFSINNLKNNNIKIIRTKCDSNGNNLGLDQVECYFKSMFYELNSK